MKNILRRENKIRGHNGSIRYDGGAKIYEAFRTFANKHIDSIDPLRNMTDEKILMEINHKHKISSALQIPEKDWEKFIK